MTAVGSRLRLPEERVESLVAMVSSRGTVSAGTLIEAGAGRAPGGRLRAVLTLLQLAKFDVLRIGSAVPDAVPQDADPAERA